MKETDTASELNRYRQAADIAYRYAKDKLERDKKPASDQKEEDAFKINDEEESRR